MPCLILLSMACANPASMSRQGRDRAGHVPRVAEVLGIGRVGLDDNFLRDRRTLAARGPRYLPDSTKEFGRSLPLGVLFAAPTVRVLAEELPRFFSTAGLFQRSVALTTSARCRPSTPCRDVWNVIGFAELSRELGLAQHSRACNR